MTRFQSLLALVQLAPAALFTSAFAALAGSGAVSLTLLLAAGMGGGAAVTVAWALRDRVVGDPE